MTTRVLLISHAATAATRRAAFPLDEPLAVVGEPAPVPRFQHAVCGPELRCRETAKLLGVQAVIEPRLRDCDYGRWRGRTLDELSAEEPAAVSSWLTDPTSAPHNGESIVDILRRVGGWLDELVTMTGRVVAITHPSVIKSAMVHAIHGRPESFWRIDVAPLSRVSLSGRSGGWVLQSLG
jgi:broad specificity phosphatase PhoE